MSKSHVNFIVRAAVVVVLILFFLFVKMVAGIENMLFLLFSFLLIAGAMYFSALVAKRINSKIASRLGSIRNELNEYDQTISLENTYSIITEYCAMSSIAKKIDHIFYAMLATIAAVTGSIIVIIILRTYQVIQTAPHQVPTLGLSLFSGLLFTMAFIAWTVIDMFFFDIKINDTHAKTAFLEMLLSNRENLLKERSKL